MTDLRVERLKHYAICLEVVIGLALAVWILTGGNPSDWGVMAWGVTK
jgi:hypothetical protein